VHEILEITPEVTRLAMKRANSADIQAAAMEEGMIPMREDAIRKALRGVTTLEEALTST
jgi:type IV pilus assembly protein PilB